MGHCGEWRQSGRRVSAISEQLPPSGAASAKFSRVRVSEPPRPRPLKGQPRSGGTLGRESSPALCAPRCWGPGDALGRVARSEPGPAAPPEGTPGGRTVAGEGAQVWTLRRPCPWDKAGCSCSLAAGPDRPEPPAFPRCPPPNPASDPRDSHGRTLPHAARSPAASRRGPEGRATRIAANGRGRLIQSERLKGAAAPPPSLARPPPPSRAGHCLSPVSRLCWCGVQQRGGPARTCL